MSPVKSYKKKKIKHPISITLFNQIREIGKRKRIDIAYQILAECYQNIEQSVVDYQRFLDDGFHNRDIQYVFKYLLENNIIDRVSYHSYAKRQACEYKLTRSALESAYDTPGFYSTLHNAIINNPSEKRKKCNVDDDIIKNFYKNCSINWNGKPVLQYILDDVTDQEQKQKMWGKIKDVPTGIIKSNWRRSDINYRMFASDPAVQNISKELRPLGFVNNGSEIWNIDYKGQEPNILALLTGNEPDYTHERFSNELGIFKYKVKFIVNNYLNGQTFGNYFYTSENEYNLDYERYEYDHIIEEFEKMFPDKNNLCNNRKELGRILKQKGADMLDDAIRFGLKPGLPLHDGIIINGSKQDADDCADAFRKASRKLSKKLTGKPYEFIVEIDAIGNDT